MKGGAPTRAVVEGGALNVSCPGHSVQVLHFFLLQTFDVLQKRKTTLVREMTGALSKNCRVPLLSRYETCVCTM